MGFCVLSLSFVYRRDSGKHTTLQPGSILLGDLPGPFWLFDHSDAFADFFLSDYSTASYTEEETCEMKKQHIVLLSGIFLILLFAIGVFFYKAMLTQKLDFLASENASVFIREHSQVLGNDDAKVYLIKFSDPACETCSAFHPFVKHLMAANPGKIKLVLRYAPFHDGADYFVKILEAAKKTGKILGDAGYYVQDPALLGQSSQAKAAANLEIFTACRARSGKDSKGYE